MLSERQCFPETMDTLNRDWRLPSAPCDPLADGVPGADFRATNYAPNAVSGLVQSRSLTDSDGILSSGSRIATRDVLVGTTYTAAIGERQHDPGSQSRMDLVQTSNG